MPRPTDVPEDFFEKSEQTFNSCEEIPAALKNGPVRKTLLEVWHSAMWLQGQLAMHGLDEDSIQEVSFAHGQMSLGRDPWDVAYALMGEHLQGRVPIPGEELAERALFGGSIPMRKVPEGKEQ